MRFSYYYPASIVFVFADYVTFEKTNNRILLLENESCVQFNTLVLLNFNISCNLTCVSVQCGGQTVRLTHPLVYQG